MSESAGSVATMIHRFREAVPMSRAERAAQKDTPTHMWWEDPTSHPEPTKDKFTVTTSTYYDDSQTLDQPKPRELSIRPAVPSSSAPLYPSNSMIKRNRNSDALVASIDLDELISKEISLLAQEMHRQDTRRTRESTDSLASADIQLEERGSPTRRNSKLRNSRQRPIDEELRTIYEDEDEYANYFSSRKATTRDAGGNRHMLSTSIRLDDILHSSVETLGSAGFKALLLPELKLDGAKPVVERKEEQGQGNLQDVNVNLDELLKSLSDAREKIKKSSSYLPEGVDETIPQITNKLNADMLQFKQLFDSKYSAEEELEKERKVRDAEMKEIGRKEEREAHAMRLLDLVPVTVDLLPDRNPPAEFQRDGALSIDRAVWRVDRSGHAMLIHPRPNSPVYNGPVNEMLVDHPPLLQELARNSRSGLPQRDERVGRQRGHASRRGRIQRVGHGDFAHSYNQRGGRQPDLQGEDVEEYDDGGDAPSDVRKMFNPYPDLVHENILGISKGICSVLDVAMATLQTRLPNKLKDQDAKKQPDLPTVTMPPSLISTTQTNVPSSTSSSPTSDEPIPSNAKDVERAAPANAGDTSSLKLPADTVSATVTQPTDAISKSIETSGKPVPSDGPELNCIASIHTSIAKPKKTVREQLDALDSVLGVDQSTNSDNFLDRMEVLPFRATISRQRDVIENRAVTVEPSNYGDNDDSRMGNNSSPRQQAITSNPGRDSNRVRFMVEDESYPPAWNKGQGSSVAPAYSDSVETASAPPIILSRDMRFPVSTAVDSLPPVHHLEQPFQADLRRVRSGGTTVVGDDFSPFAPLKRPAEGSAIRSLRQGTSNDRIHEYTSAAQSVERQKLMQFQFSNNDKLLSRGDKNSEDKENQFQNQGGALMDQRNGDTSSVWKAPSSASRQDKVAYLADMKKLREQIQLIL